MTTIFEKDDVQITRFFGGKKRGVCYQIDEGPGYIELPRLIAARMAIELLKDVFSHRDGRPCEAAVDLDRLEGHLYRLEHPEKGEGNV